MSRVEGPSFKFLAPPRVFPDTPLTQTAAIVYPPTSAPIPYYHAHKSQLGECGL